MILCAFGGLSFQLGGLLRILMRNDSSAALLQAELSWKHALIIHVRKKFVSTEFTIILSLTGITDSTAK